MPVPRAVFPRRFFSEVAVNGDVFPSQQLAELGAAVQAIPGQFLSIPPDAFALCTLPQSESTDSARVISNSQGSSEPLGRAARLSSLSCGEAEAASELWYEYQTKAASFMSDPSNDAVWRSPSRAGVVEFPLSKAALTAMQERPVFTSSLPRPSNISGADYIPSMALMQQLVRLQEEGGLDFKADAAHVAAARQVLKRQPKGRRGSSFSQALLKPAIQQVCAEVSARAARSSLPAQGWAALRRLQELGDALVMSLADEGVFAEVFPAVRGLTAASRCLRAVVECLWMGGVGHPSQRHDCLAQLVGNPTRKLLHDLLHYSSKQMEYPRGFTDHLRRGVNQLQAAAASSGDAFAAAPTHAALTAAQQAIRKRTDEELQMTLKAAEAGKPASAKAKKAGAKAKKANPPPGSSAALPLGPALDMVAWRLVDCGGYFVLQADVMYVTDPSRIPARVAVSMRPDTGRLRTSAGGYVPPRLPQQPAFSGFMDNRSEQKHERINVLAVDPVHGVYQASMWYFEPPLANCAFACPPALQALQCVEVEQSFYVLQPRAATSAYMTSILKSILSAITVPFRPGPYPALLYPNVPLASRAVYKERKRQRLLEYKHAHNLPRLPSVTEAGLDKHVYTLERVQGDKMLQEYAQKKAQQQLRMQKDEADYRLAPPICKSLTGKPMLLSTFAVCSLPALSKQCVCIAVIGTSAQRQRLQAVSDADTLYLLCPQSSLKPGQTDFVVPSATEVALLGLDSSQLQQDVPRADLAHELRVFRCSLSAACAQHAEHIQFREVKSSSRALAREHFEVASDHDSLYALQNSSQLVKALSTGIRARMHLLIKSLELLPELRQRMLDVELEAARAAGFDLRKERLVFGRATGASSLRQGMVQPSQTVSQFFAARRFGFFERGLQWSSDGEGGYPSVQHTPLIAPSPWKISTQGLLDLIEHNCMYDSPSFLQFTRSAGFHGALTALCSESDGGSMDCSWVQPPGLDSTLFDYQRKTVAWMIQQEELPRGMSTFVYNKIPTPDGMSLYLSPSGKLSKEPPLQANGGAIFSTMGTGKTIMTLALIMSRPRHPEECDLGFGARRAEAWKAACDRQRNAPQYRGAANELAAVKATMYTGMFSPRRFRSRATLIIAPVSLVGQWESEVRKHTPGTTVVLWHGDTRTQDNFSKLLSCDVVMTTYELLASCSALFSLIDWHRVVFDESQRMKNASIKMVWFAQRISAQRRWLLSGTPISHTGLKDLGGQLAALHAPDAFWEVEYLDKEAASQAADAQRFHLPVAESKAHTPKTALSLRIGSIPAAVFALWWRGVARRQTVQGLIARGEIALPESQEETLIIPFSALSQEEQLVYRAIRSSVVKSFRRVSAVGAHRGLAAAYIRSLSLLRRLRMAIGDILSVLDSAAGIEQEEAEEEAKGAAAMTSAAAAGKTPKEKLQSFVSSNAGSSGTEAAMARILSSCEEDCIICFCPLLQLSILPCLHLVCKDCWKQLLACSGGRSADCPMCRTSAKAGTALLFDQNDALKLLEEEEEQEEELPPAATSTVAIAIASLKARQQSSKITFAVRHIESTLRAEPHSKLIVFSQFTKTVHSMSRALRRVGVKSCLITGATSMTARTQQLYEFAHDASTRVFVLSIRSAGVGLNLTAANHVLFMEPNENIALVSQAVSRVLRLGQTKVVKVAHLQVDDSVEADISAWAERIRVTQGIRADTREGEHVSELARVSQLQNPELPASATLVQSSSKESKGRLQQRWEDISTIFASITRREAASPSVPSGAAAAE